MRRVATESNCARCNELPPPNLSFPDPGIMSLKVYVYSEIELMQEQRYDKRKADGRLMGIRLSDTANARAGAEVCAG